MLFTLPSLPYSYDALEPHIDARTMEIHHTKHHQAYINNANKALEGHPQLAAKPVYRAAAARGMINKVRHLVRVEEEP